MDLPIAQGTFHQRSADVPEETAAATAPARRDMLSCPDAVAHVVDEAAQATG